jgi:hypothetical protein
VVEVRRRRRIGEQLRELIERRDLDRARARQLFLDARHRAFGRTARTGPTMRSR